MLPSVKNLPEFSLTTIWGFSQANVAISQAQVAVKFFFNDAASGSNKNIDAVMNDPGWIVGLGYTLDVNKIAGILGISPTVNGNEPATTHQLYRLALANAARKKSLRVASGQGIPFAAGDLLGMKLTSDASFLPAASADLNAYLTVIFNLAGLT